MADISADAIPGYRILDYLGGGGMGDVYKALHLSLDRLVAMKIAHLPSSESAMSGVSILNEARVIARLEHPHIVKIYDCFAFNNQVVMVIEFLDGMTLEDLQLADPEAGLPEEYRKLFGQDGLLRPDWVAGAAIQVAEALDFAHAHGVFHLDIKPSNIFVLRSGDIKLLDFNIAHDLHARGMTRTGTLIGSPPYMSPEQIQQEAVDGRADLYSLGCVLYHLLTGELPFNDTSQILICIQHLQSDAKDPQELNPSLPRYLRDAVVKLMQKEREARFATASEFRDYLVPHLLAAAGVKRDPAEKTRDGNLARAGVLVVAFVVFTAAGFFGINFWPREEPVQDGPVSIAPELPPATPRALPEVPSAPEWQPMEQWIRDALAQQRLVTQMVYIEPQLTFDSHEKAWQITVRNDNSHPVEVSLLLAESRIVAADTSSTDSLAIGMFQAPAGKRGFGAAFAEEPIVIDAGRTRRLNVAPVAARPSRCLLRAAFRLGDLRYAAKTPEGVVFETSALSEEAQLSIAFRNALAFPMSMSAAGEAACWSNASAAIPVVISDTLLSPRAIDATRNLEQFVEAAVTLAVSQNSLPGSRIRFSGAEPDPFLGVVELGFEMEDKGTLQLHAFILEGTQTVSLIRGTEKEEQVRSLSGMYVSREIPHAQLRRTVKIDLPEALKRPLHDATLRFDRTQRVEIKRMLVYCSSDGKAEENLNSAFTKIENYTRQF